MVCQLPLNFRQTKNLSLLVWHCLPFASFRGSCYSPACMKPEIIRSPRIKQHLTQGIVCQGVVFLQVAPSE